MGSRVVKNEEDHRVTIRTDVLSYARLIPGGKLAYLWIGDGPDGHVVTISGPVALRALAKAILREVPAP